MNPEPDETWDTDGSASGRRTNEAIIDALIAQSMIQPEIQYNMRTAHEFAYISFLVSIVAFVSRAFFEADHIAAQGMPTGYEICEKQSFSHLSIRRRGAEPARDLVPDAFQDRLGPLAVT